MLVAEFQRDVLDKSQNVPIVVDFWAPWCGPCRFLGPNIEALADAANGAWELVKVNTDESPELAMDYKIQGIPAVKMFHKGEVIAEFSGALPKPQIQQWLDEHLPDARKDVLTAIYAMLDVGLYEQAQKDLEKFILENPDVVEARIWLANLVISEDPIRAISLVQDISQGHKHAEEAEDIRILARLLSIEVQQAPEKIQDNLKAAQMALRTRDYEALLQALIQIIMVNKGYSDEIARKATIAIFHALGETHELTRKFRPRFSMALY